MAVAILAQAIGRDAPHFNSVGAKGRRPRCAAALRLPPPSDWAAAAAAASAALRFRLGSSQGGSQAELEVLPPLSRELLERGVSG